jgi:hypothetical protein
MSVKVYNEPIPVSKMFQFNEILKASGGRYLNNPRNRRDYFLVNYEYSPEKGFAQRWDKATQDIMEDSGAEGGEDLNSKESVTQQAAFSKQGAVEGEETPLISFGMQGELI